MQIYYGSEYFSSPGKHSVVTLGNFDGVHLAHQKLITAAIARGKQLDAVSVVYTFDPHPAKILSPNTCPPLIQTSTQKLFELEKLHVDVCVVEKFSHDFAKLSPKAFFENILYNKLKAKAIVVGHDFTFGVDRHGNDETLRSFGKQYNVDIVFIEPFFIDGTLVSSSAIRRLVLTGDVSNAAKLLGSNFSISGTVVQGRGIGGKLFVKTANLQTENELIPANGVYLSNTILDDGRKIPSITSIGDNPTIAGLGFSIETHLIDFDEKLRGRKIGVEFITRLREQKAFASTDALAKQITFDVELAKTLHSGAKTS